MDPSSSLSLVPHEEKRLKHDVFLSYLKEDTGDKVVSHLKGHLHRACFDISDHTSLPIGQDRSSELVKAIEESYIFVVVFSFGYPFSKKCLDELVLICDSVSKSNKNNRRRVFPIFYGVNPSHVRSQQGGSFLQAFQAHHDNHVDPRRIEKWRHVLEDAGKGSGEVFQSGMDQEKFLSDVVKQLGKLKLPLELFYLDHAVGIEPRAQNLISELSLDDPAPSITAVVGKSGSGKTTLIKAVYDRIVPNFEASCFIENVRFYKDDNWMLNLRRDVISRFNGVDYGIYNYNILASSQIIKCVRNQKVLLVLDDVVKYEQLQALGIHDPAAFYEGSRILVTTTDKQSLVSLKKHTSYNMKLLNYQESFELFTKILYEEGQSADEEFVFEIVYRAGGLPLMLNVWGLHFKSHEREKWPRLLKEIRRISHEDVQMKLKVSYDSLSPRAKKVFLYIACINRNGIYTHSVKETFGYIDIEIQNLKDKGLIFEDHFYDDRPSQKKIGNKLWNGLDFDEYDYEDGVTYYVLKMHHLIRKMGIEVARQQTGLVPDYFGYDPLPLLQF
uniref:disease resistance protein RUN1-like n=1 Tax=Erigeron canadensis TaxID=72917 RepID=UPI001CB945A8|nr:disease resistance protein RUN1-like [Erigeron canadensis]